MARGCYLNKQHQIQPHRHDPIIIPRHITPNLDNPFRYPSQDIKAFVQVALVSALINQTFFDLQCPDLTMRFARGQ